MAKRAAVRYVCDNCGAISSTWAGRCPQCGEWNTLQEEVDVDVSTAAQTGHNLKTESVGQVVKHDMPRLVSGLEEIDTIFGGGLVAGSVSLMTGQPGIGKSTILLQLAHALAGAHNILYVSGEESAHQVGLRAQRLGVSDPKLQLATTNNADDVAATIGSGDFQLVIVDSIQTMTLSALHSAAGTVSQITGSTALIMAAAKRTNTAVILVGHVTKEGMIAGPKILEHIVDVVLQLEGDAYGGFKLLRATKNRFGSTNEVGLFEMVATGLQPVDNPSAALLAERQASDGSIVLATIEGTRPLLVEVQALVNPTSYGYPKRAASGIDLNRVTLLVAMLEKRTKLRLGDQDIYVNIVGGMRLHEPAADLAICMAIGSAAKGLQLKGNAVVFGEVGLSGEVRHVPFVDKRLAEAKKLGFNLAIGPKQPDTQKSSLLHPVGSVREALNEFLSKD
jgi:DNA repair protein RadA/Sms